MPTHQHRLNCAFEPLFLPAKAAHMTIAHLEQPSFREHCDGIGQYLSAVTKSTAASNGVRESRPARAANATA